MSTIIVDICQLFIILVLVLIQMNCINTGLNEDVAKLIGRGA